MAENIAPSDHSASARNSMDEFMTKLTEGLDSSSSALKQRED